MYRVPSRIISFPCERTSVGNVECLLNGVRYIRFNFLPVRNWKSGINEGCNPESENFESYSHTKWKWTLLGFVSLAGSFILLEYGCFDFLFAFIIRKKIGSVFDTTNPLSYGEGMCLWCVDRSKHEHDGLVYFIFYCRLTPNMYIGILAKCF